MGTQDSWQEVPRLLSRKDAAQYLGRTEPALRAMSVRRTGPKFVRFGRTVRYRREDLDAWVDRLPEVAA